MFGVESAIFPKRYGRIDEVGINRNTATRAVDPRLCKCE
jgi:hypothetical protein